MCSIIRILNGMARGVSSGKVTPRTCGAKCRVQKSLMLAKIVVARNPLQLLSKGHILLQTHLTRQQLPMPPVLRVSILTSTTQIPNPCMSVSHRYHHPVVPPRLAVTHLLHPRLVAAIRRPQLQGLAACLNGIGEVHQNKEPRQHMQAPT